jgi:hypothetical protein
MTAIERVRPTVPPSQRGSFAKLLTGIDDSAWLASLDDIASFEILSRSLGVTLAPADWDLQEQIARAISEPYQWTPTLPTVDLYAAALGLGDDLPMPTARTD